MTGFVFAVVVVIFVYQYIQRTVKVNYKITKHLKTIYVWGKNIYN